MDYWPIVHNDVSVIHHPIQLLGTAAWLLLADKSQYSSCIQFSPGPSDFFPPAYPLSSNASASCSLVRLLLLLNIMQLFILQSLSSAPCAGWISDPFISSTCSPPSFQVWLYLGLIDVASLSATFVSWSPNMSLEATKDPKATKLTTRVSKLEQCKAVVCHNIIFTCIYSCPLQEYDKEMMFLILIHSHWLIETRRESNYSRKYFILSIDTFLNHHLGC